MVIQTKVISVSDLEKIPIFNGVYDKKHANEHFIYGIETVMEHIRDVAKCVAEMYEWNVCSKVGKPPEIEYIDNSGEKFTQSEIVEVTCIVLGIKKVSTDFVYNGEWVDYDNVIAWRPLTIISPYEG